MYWVHILHAIVTGSFLCEEHAWTRGLIFPQISFLLFYPIIFFSCVILQLVAPGCGYHYDIGICLLLNHTVYNRNDY